MINHKKLLEIGFELVLSSDSGEWIAEETFHYRLSFVRNNVFVVIDVNVWEGEGIRQSHSITVKRFDIDACFAEALTSMDFSFIDTTQSLIDFASGLRGNE